MVSSAINSQVWDVIYQSGQGTLAYPNENLVRIVFSLFKQKEARSRKVLDLGFGSGNNLVFLQEFGFDTYGIEVSSAAQQIALKRCGSTFDPQRLKLIEVGSELPFDSDFFEIVVSWQVLYYNTSAGLERALAEIYRVMKTGAVFISTLATGRDIAAMQSVLISKTERVIEGITTQKNAIITVIENEGDLLALYAKFKNIKVGYFESNLLGRPSSHWVIICEK